MPPTWIACRRCGTTIGAPVEAPLGVGVGAVGGVGGNGSAPPASRSHLPAPPQPGAFDLLPKTNGSAPPPPAATFDLLPTPNGSAAPRSRPTVHVAAGRHRAGSAPARSLLGLFVALGVGVLLVAGWVAWPDGDGSDTASRDDSRVLDPIGTGGAGVQDAFRVQAEANVRMASSGMQVLYAQSGDVSAITAAALTQFDPTVQYVDGATASTASSMASVATTADSVTVAVAAQGGICAFARLAATGSLDTVTITSSAPCLAGGAPVHGWTPLAGAGGGGVLAPDGSVEIPPSASLEPGLSPN